VLPDVFTREHQMFSKSLLKSGMKFITPSGLQGSGLRSRTREQRTQHRGIASETRKHEVFVERGFKDAGVGCAKNRSARFDVVSEADAWFSLFVTGEPIVEVATQPEIQGPVAEADDVAGVHCEFLHVSVAAKVKQSTIAGQVVGREDGIVIRA